MADAVIEARHITRILPGAVPVTLVRDIDLVIRTGEFIAITGPSGSGKSSLLYLLGLLDVPTEGVLCLEGRDTAKLDDRQLAALRLTKLGFVFQFHFLLPEFTALANVMIPMRKLGRLPDTRMRRRASDILADLGLGEKMEKRPDQLSGGERQRVAIARALANDPLVILADEPTGNLDRLNSRNVFDIFGRLTKELGTTVVAVTHELELAELAHRRIELLDGRVVADTRTTGLGAA